ncbi:PLP-dependent aminotransferase family protein [Paludibacterium purpuratum]|uniref:Putative 8-amino-7-oxononanoate synthase n=1 Tax=Paludibacterium purpuratum TaxID=1144873 RepID=A0A4R7B1M0_9NEIS|nr:PLP-dependent aminotransferase family protein [Paludibacterium purpuratum]TDR73336.1 GntR family transcriptional regulator/MocR family aminotransferase [Paludibacterium purpuratum]
MTKNLLLPTFSLQTDSDEVLYRQLYHRFKDAIANGSYPPGARVPSIRTLAQQLNVSRNTVEMAYDLLVGEGYFVSNGQAGTSVARQFSRQQVRRQPEPDNVPALPPVRPFQIGIPAQDAFPRKLWGNLRQAHSKEHQIVAGSQGYAPLRSAIAAYLNIARGIQCGADQVIVTTGYRQSLQLLLTGLLEHGQSVWTEDPCYPPSQYLLAQNRIPHHPLPVDAEGIIVGAGIKQAPEARVAIVTPANQSPLGVVMSAQRKAELLDWAVDNQRWLIEDDYDSEYCGDSRLAPTLSSLDRDGRTFYMGTFSKTLCPALRLAYVVVPCRQIARFVQLAEHILDGCPLHSQKTLADMMQQGYYARHIKKTRPLYEARRAMLVEVLTARFGQRLSISPSSRGLCLLAHLPPGVSDVEVQARAAQIGLSVGALSPRALRHDYGQALLLGFANFTTRQDAERAVDSLAACL